MEMLDQHLKGGVKLLAADFENGKLEAGSLEGHWTHTGRKLIRLDKASLRFGPEEIAQNKKPDVSLIITGLNFYFGKELKSLLSKQKNKKQEASSELPLSISRILVGSSSVHLLDYPGIGKQKHLTLNGIFGNINHITKKAGTPLGKFNFNATFEGSAKLMANGKFDLAHSPVQFSVDYRLFSFMMDRLNPELRERLPLTFKEGEFHLVGEVIKREDIILGYFKPMLEDAQYLGNKKEFKNPKHFFLEIGATITNWLLENSETNKVAAKVPFVIKDGSVDFNAGKALWSSIENGLLETDKVKARSDQYRLKQAQEESPDKQ
jgi:hypothetical protein